MLVSVDSDHLTVRAVHDQHLMLDLSVAKIECSECFAAILRGKKPTLPIILERIAIIPDWRE